MARTTRTSARTQRETPILDGVLFPAPKVEEAPAPAPKAAAPKATPAPKPARTAPCLCGCGEVPSGKNRFRQGHDARTASRLCGFLRADETEKYDRETSRLLGLGLDIASFYGGKIAREYAAFLAKGEVEGTSETETSEATQAA